MVTSQECRYQCQIPAPTAMGITVTFVLVACALGGSLRGDEMGLLDGLSFADLLGIPVLSAAKKEQAPLDATAAITVLDDTFLGSDPATSSALKRSVAIRAQWDFQAERSE